MHIQIDADGTERFNGTLRELLDGMVAAVDVETFLGEVPKNHVILNAATEGNIVVLTLTKDTCKTAMNGNYTGIRGIFEEIMTQSNDIFGENDPAFNNIIKAIRASIPLSGKGKMTVEYENGTVTYDGDTINGAITAPFGLDMLIDAGLAEQDKTADTSDG